MNLYHKIQVVIDLSIDTRTYSASYTRELIDSLIKCKLEQLSANELKEFQIEMSTEVVSSIDKDAKE